MTTSVPKRPCIEHNRIQSIRNMVLCVLSAEVRQRHEPLYCVDVLDKSGQSGIIWKSALKDQIHVTIADREIDDSLKSNLDTYSLLCRDLPLDINRIPGDPMEPQHVNELFIAKCSANVVLHMEAFDFVNMNPNQHLVNVLDSAVMNLKHNGILCVSSTDISSKFTRTAHVIHRHYGASVIKTSYMKELALRIVIANIVRSCAKCNKGIDVLLSVCAHDNFLIVVRILRGAKEGDSCIDKIVPVLHCQICEERVFHPNTLSPQEDPYSLLPCSCNKNNPGKTAVILGPAWSGKLFNVSFLDSVLHGCKDLDWNFSDNFSIETLMEEAKCPNCSLPEDNNEEPDKKKTKLSPTEEPMPPFYYNLHAMKLKSVEHPKFSRLLEYLRQDGYKCSRTHLDVYGVRTNATLKQITDIMYKYCKQKT
ncbi:unnamed protein product [Mytilus coruscus]|uniref:Uncharacterized protein n=1 Tax=Mytilus coruscus TaxID=42192 RepID=A0A6J8EGU1_MYTCO|nr:unnamed protein product [Mytilus coruscus]